MIPGTPPPPPPPPPIDENGEPMPYFPYKDINEYRLAYFLFNRNQMPGTEINELMQIWADTLSDNGDPPFASHADLYATIDATTLGDAPWQSFSVSYTGNYPVAGEIPPWMLASYDVWFRDPRLVLQNQLRNSGFKNAFDYAPFQKFNKKGEREWRDFMSANWGYQQAVSISSPTSQVDAILTIDRILLLKTLRLMARFLYPSFWAAIRPQCQSQLGKMSSILCIYQTGIYTTTFVARTWMELVFWHFFRFPKVSTAEQYLLYVYNFCFTLKLIESTKAMINSESSAASFSTPL